MLLGSTREVPSGNAHDYNIMLNIQSKQLDHILPNNFTKQTSLVNGAKTKFSLYTFNLLFSEIHDVFYNKALVMSVVKPNERLNKLFKGIISHLSICHSF